MSEQEESILREVERCLRLGLRYVHLYPAAQSAGYEAVQQRLADAERITSTHSLFRSWLDAQRGHN